MKKFICAFIVCICLSSSVHALIILQDNFEYAVDRDTTNDALIFTSTGPWEGVKSYQNTGQTGAKGYLYTTQSIAGFSGSFPGRNSSYVMAMEMLPQTLYEQDGGISQTDAYLAFGNESAAQDKIPSNVWFQFWIYIQNYGSQQTQWDMSGGKWLYPCINGSATCSPSYVSFLGLLKPISYNSYNESASGADVYHVLECTGCNYTPGSDPGVWKIGHNQSAYGGLLEDNVWVLVKIHVDHSGSSPLVAAGQGVYEEWHMQQGQTFFTKVAEWLGGVTPNFTWDVTSMGSGYETGNKSFKLGTTFGTVGGSTYDQYLFVDDFVIAGSESDLPTYTEDSPETTDSALRFGSGGSSMGFGGASTIGIK